MNEQNAPSITQPHPSTSPVLLGVQKISSAYRNFLEQLEKFLPLLTVMSFALGIGVSMLSARVGTVVTEGMSTFVDFYGYFAPVAIFIILAPSLARIIEAGRGRFASYAIMWFSSRRLMSCLWAAIFTAIVFGFPVFTGSSGNLGQAIWQTIKSLGWMATHSSYFYAMYAAVAIVFISKKSNFISKILSKCGGLIETLGQFFVPIVPIFMFSIGAYIYALPSALQEQLGGESIAGSTLHDMKVFGFGIASNTPVGMILSYVIAALLTGIACFIWQFGLIGITKRVSKSFSIKDYFRKYWIRVYPLLWATSSEALATPLNLYLVKKYYPQIKAEVRRFVVGIGSYISINGTMISVFLLAGAVASILGIQLSLVELILCIPLVFLIGFGVPGIPGELVLFAGPIVILLSNVIPPAIAPAFIALYLGLQLGLPDSFRTGNNSTDDCVFSILLNEIYIKKFAGDKLEKEAECDAPINKM